MQQRCHELAVNAKTKRILTAIIGTLKITLRIHKRVFLFWGNVKKLRRSEFLKIQKKISHWLFTCDCHSAGGDGGTFYSKFD